jgi:hypothetical protein
VSGVAAHGGAFGPAQAERLLWRAGFGPRRGEAEALARLGLDGAIHALYGWPVTQAGRVVDETYKLLPGRYVLYCSVANHRALGMQGTPSVRR